MDNRINTFSVKELLIEVTSQWFFVKTPQLLLLIRFIVLFSCVDFNNDFVVNNGLNFLSLLMVLVLILVSSCVMNNSIDYLSIMEGRIFLVYILLFQFSMITFVLSNDPIIVSFNRD